MFNKLISELNKHKDPARARVMQRFFKTGAGEYGEGDVFLGLSVPKQRAIAKNYLNLSLPEIKKLLRSQIHEHRFTAIIILVTKYQKGPIALKKRIFQFYLANAKRVNNWDLVDTSAPYIIGDFLFDKNKSILYKLAKSNNLWEKRIAILATFAFIKRQQFFYALKIAEMLLTDKHDLIHKAVGWMLREVGNKDIRVEEKFLKTHYKNMSRTALRYAIEKMSRQNRQFYLK
jgi:3-methyladenine DNA glycosylase AlkD